MLSLYTSEILQLSVGVLACVLVCSSCAGPSAGESECDCAESAAQEASGAADDGESKEKTDESRSPGNFELISQDVDLVSYVAARSADAGVRADSYAKERRERKLGNAPGEPNFTEVRVRAKYESLAPAQIYDLFEAFASGHQPAYIQRVKLWSSEDWKSFQLHVTFVAFETEIEKFPESKLEERFQVAAWQAFGSALELVRDRVDGILRADFDSSRHYFSFVGIAGSAADVDEIVDALNTHSCISEVDMKPIRVWNASTAKFELDGTFECSGEEPLEFERRPEIWSPDNPRDRRDFDVESEEATESGAGDEPSDTPYGEAASESAAESDSGTRVTVYSKPRGEIVVDDAATGERRPGTVEVSPGPHEVRVEFDDGSPSETKRIDIEEGDRLKLFYRKESD